MPGLRLLPRMAGSAGRDCAREGEDVYCTDDRLQRLSAEVDEFEKVAFQPGGQTAKARKDRMRFAAQSCSDENVRHILGRSVGDIVQHPEYVRRAVGLARGHIDTLRNARTAN